MIRMVLFGLFLAKEAGLKHCILMKLSKKHCASDGLTD
jgi:hypothetical protein